MKCKNLRFIADVVKVEKHSPAKVVLDFGK